MGTDYHRNYRKSKITRSFKNGQTRETGNIGYTNYKTKTDKTNNTTQYVLDTQLYASKRK